MNRSRYRYAFWIIFVIALGLASRRFSVFLPPFIATYAGDTLWALMVFLLFGWMFPAMATRRVALIALLFSVIIEISQLYSPPWLVYLRNLPLGALILGRGFLWSDLICYAIGIGFGVIAEKISRSA